MWTNVQILSNICHSLKIGIEVTNIRHLFSGQKQVNLWTKRATGGPGHLASRGLFFLVWAVGDCGRQVGNGDWVSKHLEYQPYQVVDCCLDNIGTCLGTKLLSNFCPAYVQK